MDFPYIIAEKHGFSNTESPKNIPNRWIFSDKVHYFCCIYTIFTRILKISTDLKTPFDGEYRQLVQLGTWRLYHGVFFYYRSLEGSRLFSNDCTPPVTGDLNKGSSFVLRMRRQ